MNDLDKTKEQLIEDLAEMRRRVTALEKTEEDLRTTRLQLSEAMDLAGIVYWEVDLNTNAFIFNDAFYAFYGTTAEAEGGYRMEAAEYRRRFIHPDDAAMVMQEIERVKSGKEPGHFDIEHRIVRRDGEVRSIIVRTRGIRDGSGKTVRRYGASQDITDRKRSEDVLRASQFQLSEAANLAQIAYFENDLAGGTIVLNDAYYGVYGTTAEAEGGYRMAPEEFKRRFIHPDDIPRFEELVARNLEREKRLEPSLDIEHRTIRRDGEVRHILLRTKVVRDGSGRVTRRYGACQDITERKRSEEATIRLNRELRAISDCNQTLLRAEDEQTLLHDICRIVCDEAGYRMAWVGYAGDDEGKSVRPVAWAGLEEPPFADPKVTWADTERGQGPTGTAVREGKTVYIQDFTTDPRMAPWAEDALKRGYRSSIALPLKDERARTFGAFSIYSPTAHAFTPDEVRLLEELSGDLAFGIMVLRARVERKRAEEVLRSTRLQLSEAVDLAGIVYWEFDPAADTFIFSDAFYALLGTTTGREGGYLMAIGEYAKRFAHPDDLPMLEQALETIRSGKDPEFIIDVGHRIIRRDGEVRHILTRTRGTRDDLGRITRCYGASQDITKRKEAEEENSRLQAQLLQAQKMEAIGTLAGGIAHDFNNILTVIMGFANLARMSVAEDDRLRPYLDQILISSERAADLTQSLLAFGRKQKITLAPRDINDVVRNASKLLVRLLHEDIELKLKLTEKTVVADADLAQMDQVLMNLATNARDAMPNGGFLTIGTDVAVLDETFEKTHGFGRPGAYVRISVSDTGVGMDERTMTRIFDPFFTTKEVGKGTGLGLASVYGIVKQHNGYITVTSALLEGTTFNIYLPLVEMKKHVTTAGAVVRGGSETILVIEDDAHVRTLITKILSDRGYTTLEAPNGDDGIRSFHAHKDRIGLVILDVVMPGKNGKEVFDQIARISPKVKAIFMSGYTGDVVIDKGVQKENVDFLQKPLSVANLLAKVREVLDR